MLANSFLTLLSASSFNCSEIKPEGTDLVFDVSRLSSLVTLTDDRTVLGTKFSAALRFDLCGVIPDTLEGVPKEHMCPTGTKACLTLAERRKGDDKDDIKVLALAREDDTPAFSFSSSPTPTLKITLHGESPLTFDLTLICPKSSLESEDSLPIWHYPERGISWTVPEACGHKAGEEAPETDPDNKDGDDNGGGGGGGGGSSVGWFFLMLLLAILAYFGLGAYHNYTTYGARGLDLIPHRTFWSEVPYIMQDVVSHLCSAIRPSSGRRRGGYVAV